ncbi:hypothetical protein J3454_04120 [Erythrobacter sp. NFXS35]|uniref:hypothetical protein n=1 Tax=Erythrobacter sp. NFXS35 TaxID=2818436 RepID=UPI0032DE7C36
MVRGAAILLAVAASPLAAQQAGPAPKANVLVIPAPKERSPHRFPKVEPVKTVDIPQWAKDAGHNGHAIYTAIVAPDDTLISLELKRSSGSAAIDAAVKARAETLWYRAGTDAAGNPVESEIPVRIRYARFDEDSPGGGIDAYSCRDLVREEDWFHAANADREDPVLLGDVFLPELVYLTLGSMLRLERGEPTDDATVDADIAARKIMWQSLLERCQKTPERLLLDEVDHPEAFRRQMLRY